jgi:hypothetical protein
VLVSTVPRVKILDMKIEVANLYIRAFKGPPWFENLLVRQEGRWQRAGTESEMDKVKMLRLLGMLRDEDIKPFHTPAEVISTIVGDAKQKSYSGVLATDTANDRVVGAHWNISVNEVTDVEKLRNIRRIAKSNGFDAGRMVYLDEMFVSKEYMNLGIGSTMLKIGGLAAVRDGYTHAICRTMSSAAMRCLDKTFGRDNIVDYGRDPEDLQTERRYYIIKLASLMREYENQEDKN